MAGRQENKHTAWPGSYLRVERRRALGVAFPVAMRRLQRLERQHGRARERDGDLPVHHQVLALVDESVALHAIRSAPQGVEGRPHLWVPHQSAALYRTADDRPGIATGALIQGKPLSYNNLNDADAAFELVSEFDEIAKGVAKIDSRAAECFTMADQAMVHTAIERAMERAIARAGNWSSRASERLGRDQAHDRASD